MVPPSLTGLIFIELASTLLPILHTRNQVSGTVSQSVNQWVCASLLFSCFSCFSDPREVTLRVVSLCPCSWDRKPTLPGWEPHPHPKNCHIHPSARVYSVLTGPFVAQGLAVQGLNVLGHAVAFTIMRANAGGRQRSLFELKGVVKLGELERQHALVQDPHADQAELTAILRAWLNKSPSTAVIQSTGVGRTVRRLSKSSAVNAEVRAAAAEVYNHWRAQVEKRVELQSRGPLEVECDRPTSNWRDKARHLIDQAVNAAGHPSPDLAVRLEKTVFEACRHVIGHRYRRCVRKMVLTLRNASTPLSLSACDAFVRTHLKD